MKSLGRHKEEGLRWGLVRTTKHFHTHTHTQTQTPAQQTWRLPGQWEYSVTVCLLSAL